MEKDNQNSARVPSFAELRANKTGYRTLPIDVNSEIYDEKSYGIRCYGVAGQSYYSRNNPLTIEAISSVPPEPLLRKTVLRKLAQLNQKIKNDTNLTNILQGQVEIYVEEGKRSSEVQARLYEVEFPKLIKSQYPGISEQKLKDKLTDLIALPTMDYLSPSPHSTGAAFDLCLRYTQEESLEYRQDQKEVKLRRFDGDVSEANFPDYFEDSSNIHSKQDEEIRDNRRLFYSLLTGEYFGYETGFACNPTEWWHWSYGDQLWAFVKNQPTAFYSIAQ